MKDFKRLRFIINQGVLIAMTLFGQFFTREIFAGTKTGDVFNSLID